jgi:beta-glucosidase-like glycosyl hydrolase
MMKRTAAMALAGLALPLAACSATQARRGPAMPAVMPLRPPQVRAAAADWVPGFVSDMTDADEVGQLLVPTVTSQKAALDAVKTLHVGGFLYTAGQTASPDRTAALSNALQNASPLPLLLGIGDDRTAPFLTRLPDDRVLAATGHPDDAETVRRIAAAEARAVGITPDYGPVTGTNEIRLADAKKVRQGGVVKAVQEGADQVLDPPDAAKAQAELLRAVQKGRLSRARLDEAVTRVLRLKQARGLFGDTVADPSSAARLVGSSADRAAVAALAAHAITLVRNDHVLPLRGDKVFVTGAQTGPMTRALRAAGLHVAGSPRTADVTILATDDEGKRTAAQVRALGAHRPVVVVALGRPDDLAHLGKASAGLAAYAADPTSLAALAQVLSGSLHPAGHLPSSISGDLPAGFGLTM